MQAVILAGGLGTRLSEETTLKPKPMVEIGGMPILWHIMKIYSSYGINDFIICAGYKSHIIKDYFTNYLIQNSDVTFDLKQNTYKIHKNHSENWKVTVVDTGQSTMTGGRLLKVAEYLDGNDFCFTYGDGLTDIDINKLINFHRNNKSIATLTAVKTPERFGRLQINKKNIVSQFLEKPQNNDEWINGGFFVLSKEVLNFIDDENTIWERDPLENISKEEKLSAYKHDGFWYAMDKLSDKHYLNELWNHNQAPWKNW